MKKVIFLLLFPLIAEVVISCCNCIEPVIQHYTNKSISINHLDNSRSEPLVSTSDSIIKKAYGIRLQLIRERLACIEKRQSVFIQSAYAFSCGCPPAKQFLPKDSITAIKIYTLHDFDSNHPADSDVSGYFKIYQAFTFSTIPDYIKTSYLVLYDDRELAKQIDFLLMTVPAISGQHQFKVEITLSDGRVLINETTTIELI